MTQAACSTCGHDSTDMLPLLPRLAGSWTLMAWHMLQEMIPTPAQHQIYLPTPVHTICARSTLIDQHTPSATRPCHLDLLPNMLLPCRGQYQHVNKRQAWWSPITQMHQAKHTSPGLGA